MVCVSNFFEQPVDAVVSQEEDASPTSLHESPSSLNHYGSTDWIWGLKRQFCTSVYEMAREDLNTSVNHKSLILTAGCFCALHSTPQPAGVTYYLGCRKKSVMHETVLALYWDIKQQKFLPSFWLNPLVVKKILRNDTAKYSTACGFTLEKMGLHSVHLLEMWSLVYIGLMLPSRMNEIPFAQNIMSVCVRTASRLVEAPGTCE